MPRQSTFTESEDRIILRHANQPADVVNAALAAAGFPERSAPQLSQRRYYLRRRGPSVRVARNGNPIMALESERREVLREIETIDLQRAKLESRLRDLTDALLGEVAGLEAEVARIGRSPAEPPAPGRLRDADPTQRHLGGVGRTEGPASRTPAGHAADGAAGEPSHADTQAGAAAEAPVA